MHDSCPTAGTRAAKKPGVKGTEERLLFYKSYETIRTIGLIKAALSFENSDFAPVMASDVSVFLADIRFDFRCRVDQFLQEGGEGAEVKVTNDLVGREGYLDSYFGWAIHGVAEFATASKSPCIFTDGKEE